MGAAGLSDVVGAVIINALVVGPGAEGWGTALRHPHARRWVQIARDVVQIAGGVLRVRNSRGRPTTPRPLPHDSLLSFSGLTH